MSLLVKYILFAVVFQAHFVLAGNHNAPSMDKDWRKMLGIARQAYRGNDYQKAILFYETLLPSLPKTIDLTEEIAQTRYRLKQFEAAKALYIKKSKTKNVANARSFHNLGNIAMEEKNYKKAIQQYQNALRSNPSNEKTRYNLSEAIRRQKENDKNNPPPKKDKPENKPKDKPKDKSEEQNKDNTSALKDQSVQRELDKLLKKEAETKRKVATGKGDESGGKNQKDW